MNNPVRFNDPTGHRCEPGDNLPGGYCYSPPAVPSGEEPDIECDLQCQLDLFDGLETGDTVTEITLLGQTSRLTPEEMSLLSVDGELSSWKFNRMAYISWLAVNYAEDLFPGQSPDNSQRNAFQHAFWNALMVREFGMEFAEKFSLAHEKAPGSTKETQFMDLHNNEVGRNIGQEYLNAPMHVLVYKIFVSVQNGDMYVWDGNDIYYSNQCPLCVAP